MNSASHKNGLWLPNSSSYWQWIVAVKEVLEEGAMVQVMIDYQCQ
jgi:hypothetical protein